MVDTFWVSAVIEQVEDLAEQTGQNPVDDETGRVFYEHRSFSQPPGQFEGRSQGGFICILGPYDFNQRQHSNRVEEVKADKSFRMFQNISYSLDGEGGGVGEQQRIRT